MKIKIGADELILWIIKNKKAEDTDNFELGRKIAELMKNYGSDFEEEDFVSLWEKEKEKNDLETFKELPKTSQQYSIEIEKLPELYRELSEW